MGVRNPYSLYDIVVFDKDECRHGADVVLLRNVRTLIRVNFNESDCRSR